MDEQLYLGFRSGAMRLLIPLDQVDRIVARQENEERKFIDFRRIEQKGICIQIQAEISYDLWVDAVDGVVKVTDRQRFALPQALRDSRTGYIEQIIVKKAERSMYVSLNMEYLRHCIT